MKLQNFRDVPSKVVDMQGAHDCQVRWLVSEADGAPNFAMRQFELAPGGHTPKHSHPYEHEIYVLEGRGIVLDGDERRPLVAGDVVFVEPDDVHQFLNTGTSTLKMLCLIPNSAKDLPVTLAPECGIEATTRSKA
jgi:quercetin dioxygenase-like cupin family protein